MALKLTPSGMDLLLRTIAGEATIDFTAIQLGNGADAGESAAALSNPLLTVEISSYDVGDIFVTLTSTFSNQTVSAGFRATELGVLAKDPDDPERTLLYAYAYTQDDQADYIPASADKVLETQLDVLVYIGDAENVTASISESLVYVSKAEFDAYKDRRDNPHQVSKEQVGLGNVPNVATNDQTPTYTTPAAPAALASGEKLSTAMGKIARAVLALISHIGTLGKNVHKETPASIGAAAESHKHSTADITSGILGVSRGGTEVDSYDKLLGKLGAVKTNYLTLTLTAEGWTGESAPYTQTVTAKGVSTSSNVFPAPVLETADQVADFGAAMVLCTGQGGGTLTFTAFVGKPALDIAYNVKLEEASA